MLPWIHGIFRVCKVGNHQQTSNLEYIVFKPPTWKTTTFLDLFGGKVYHMHPLPSSFASPATPLGCRAAAWSHPIALVTYKGMINPLISWSGRIKIYINHIHFIHFIHLSLIHHFTASHLIRIFFPLILATSSEREKPFPLIYPRCVFLGHLFQRSVNHDAAHGDCKAAEINNMRILIPFNSTHKHVPFPACFSRHVRTTSLPMLSFSEAGRLHQEKNTRDAFVTRQTSPPHRMTGTIRRRFARRNYGWLSEPPAVMPETQKKKKTIDSQPIRQAQLVGQEALGKAAEKVGGFDSQLGKKSFAQLQWDVTDKGQGGYYLATHEPLERCHLAVYGLILHFPKQTQKNH